jgi:pilus assembly protein CpaF
VPAGQPTWEQLLEWGSVSREVLALFQSAIRAHCNIVIAGGTGSGKTTVLNRLTELIPPDERVVVVEAFYELQVRHPRAVRLCSDSSPDLSFADLVGTAAKMRPDRLIFGELRGPEVMHILDVIGMGHDGSLMTIHATSPEDTLTRIEAMCLTANLGLGIGEIRNLIASAIDVISVQQRLPDGSRKIVQVAELRGVENDRYVLQPLVRYDPEAGRFEFTGVKPGWEQS